MKAASGDTVNGGYMRPWPTVEGRSLEMLWVRDLMCPACRGGEAMPDDGRDIAESMLAYTIAVRSLYY